MMNGKRAFCYILSVILVVFYLFILFDSFRLDVSPAYKLYYVDHAIANYLSEEAFKQYGIDKEYRYNTEEKNKNIDYNWGGYEGGGSWMSGKESSFFIWMDSVEKDEYWLRLNVLMQFPYEKTLYVNGNYMCELPTSSSYHYALKIPGSLLEKGINVFTIKTPDAMPYNKMNPASTDQRALTSYIESVGLYSEYPSI